MKSCVLFSLLFEVILLSHVESREHHKVGSIVDHIIGDAIKKIIASVPDPMHIEKIDMDFDKMNQTIFQGYFNVTSLRVEGIKSTNLVELKSKIAESTIHIKLVIPEVLVDFWYWADITLAEIIPLYGSGRISLAFNTMTFEIDGCFKLSPISLHNLTITFTDGKADFDLNGLLNNAELSSLLSQLLDDIFCEFVARYEVLISRIISPILEILINAVLARKPASTYENLIDMAEPAKVATFEDIHN